MELPRECYKHSTSVDQIQDEMSRMKRGQVEIVDVKWDGEVVMEIKDAMFPYKTCLSPEIMWATNMFKSFIIENLKIVPVWLYLFKKEKAINGFLRFGDKIMSPYLLKEVHLTAFSRELHWCLFTFLNETGINEERADKIAELMVHLLEYDNAYRFRVQDILHTTSKERLKSPIREVRRLMKLSRDRDSEVVSKKFALLGRLMVFVLLIPKYRRAFKKVVDGVDIKKLGFDEGDLYWVHPREDYKFLGLQVKERMELAKAMGWKYPNGI